MHFQCRVPEFETKRCCLKLAIRKLWITFNMHNNKHWFRRKAEGYGCRSTIVAHKISILRHQVAGSCTSHSCWWVWIPLDLPLYVPALSFWTAQNCFGFSTSVTLLFPYLQSRTSGLLGADTGTQMQWLQGLLPPSTQQCAQPVCCLDSHTWVRWPVLDWSSHLSTQMLQKKKKCAKLHFIVMTCKKVYLASSRFSVVSSAPGLEVSVRQQKLCSLPANVCMWYMCLCMCVGIVHVFVHMCVFV